jgi:hypothetical protein
VVLHSRKTAQRGGLFLFLKETAPMTLSARSPAHAAFVSLLPRLQTHARVRFRHLDPVDREEAVADVVAYGFLSFLRLRRRGKDPTAFPAVFAHFVASAVSNGRGIVRRRSARDLMCARPRGERVTVHRLNDPRPGGGWWRDAALDRRVRVDDQATFNLDFPAWLAALPALKRRVAGLLARGHGTEDAASRTGLSAGRVSQLRRELADSWAAFHAES